MCRRHLMNEIIIVNFAGKLIMANNVYFLCVNIVKMGQQCRKEKINNLNGLKRR